MRKAPVILMVLAGLAAAAPARAQSSLPAQIGGPTLATEKFYFSLKVGLDFSYLVGLPEPAQRSGGFNVGLTATIKLNDRLSIVPEITPFFRKGIAGIAFTPTGDPEIDADFAEPTASELRLEYIDLPVLVTYRFGRINVGAGPYAGLLVSATERFRVDLESEGEALRYQRDVSDQYKSTDFGLIAEASWTVTKPRRGVGLVLGGRYAHGLTDVLATPSPSGALHNSVWHFYASFPFVF